MNNEKEKETEGGASVTVQTKNKQPIIIHKQSAHNSDGKLVFLFFIIKSKVQRLFQESTYFTTA